MFITGKEKDWMMASIQILQQQVKELAEKANKTYTPEEAPWGLKTDGTPRKRPGRAPKLEVQS